MNRNFAKPREDMTPEFAPDVLVVDGRKVYNPKTVHCRIAGYLPLSPDYPVDSAPDGQHWERTDKIEADGDGGYRWTYRLVDDPPPAPRTFDKYLLVDALMEAGIWGDVKAWLQSQDNAYDRAVMAPDISEDEPLLAQGIALAKSEFGLTDEQVEAILAASVEGGV